MTLAERFRSGSVSDENLVEKIASGELDSLGVLYDRHEGEIRRVLERLGVGNADLDDVVQFTFLQVIRAAPSFDPNFPVGRWLIGIAVMMSRRHHRSLQRTARRVASWVHAFRQVAPETPDEALASHEAERRVIAAFEQLSPKRREAFVLVALEGAAGEVAASTLGIPINTLWTRLHHARQELRAGLMKEDP